jgi:putative ABC transport system permease protein
VTSYGIAARTREIGVRVALGAAPARLVRALIVQGVRPVLFGLILGVIVSMWSGRLVERFLFGVRSFDLVTYVATVSWVLLLTVVACLLPARRATRLSPTVALRHE